MSHFAVSVFTEHKPTEDDIAAILQPWHEYECTGVDDEYVDWVDHTDKWLADWAEAIKEKTDYASPNNFAAFCDAWAGGERIGLKDCERLGIAPRTDGHPTMGNRTNPNARWDWWLIGGRWQGMLLLKPGCRGGVVGELGLMTERGAGVDSARLGDIDFARMLEQGRKNAAAHWDSQNGDNPHPLGINPKKISRTDHINSVVAFQTFAVVKDGNWYERGKMGWWACVSDEKDDWPEQFATLIGNMPEDHWLTVVDCHI